MTDTIIIKGVINMRLLLICLKVKESGKLLITEKLILKKILDCLGVFGFVPSVEFQCLEKTMYRLIILYL